MLAFEAMREYLGRYGKLLALYSDKASIFLTNKLEAVGRPDIRRSTACDMTTCRHVGKDNTPTIRRVLRFAFLPYAPSMPRVLYFGS